MLQGKRIPIVVTALTSLAVAGVFLQLDTLANESFHADQRADVIERVGALHVALEQRVNSHLKAVHAVEAVIVSKPDLDDKTFQAVGATLIAESPAIRQLQLAPNAIIQFGYPPDGMERLRGTDMRKPGSGFSVNVLNESIRDGKTRVAGPIPMAQGFTALVARDPVLLQRDGAEQFWGFVNALIDYTVFMEPVAKLLADKEISVAIRGRDGLGAQGEIFAGSAEVFRNEPITASVTLPSGEWQIGGYPAAGWYEDRPDALVMRLLMLAATVFIATITWIAASGAVRNRRMVHELRASNSRITSQAGQLEHQNEALKESVRLREEVERISRHDLKTPLNSIIAVPRLLREQLHEQKALSAESSELLGIVERAGYRLLNMVNLSLDMFRMEQGTYHFRPQAVDIGALIHKVAADIRGHAAAKKVRLDIRINGQAPAEALPVHAWADELLCYSLLANLIKNAVEASPEGKPVTVTVESNRRSNPAESDSDLELHIHNQGAVPAEVRARFFQKYASHGKAGGTGLGTYSAQLMARVQNGELRMQTSEQDGTTLTLTLRSAAAGQIGAMPKAHAIGAFAKGAPPLPPLPPLRVLVVDDDEYNLLLVRRYLPSPPLQIDTAVNGRAALDAAEANPPDVILMDLEMPIMNGLEATARLRQREHDNGGKSAIIIGLSSHDDESAFRRSVAAGCNYYLVKPVGKEELLRTIGALHAGQSITDAGRAAPVDEPGPDDPVLADPDLRGSLPSFLQSRRDAFEKMVLACEAGDRPALRQLAHRLSGSFALYGFRWASRHCKEIEREADSAGQDRLRAQLDGLRRHLEQVRVNFVEITAPDDNPASKSHNET